MAGRTLCSQWNPVTGACLDSMQMPAKWIINFLAVCPPFGKTRAAPSLFYSDQETRSYEPVTKAHSRLAQILLSRERGQDDNAFSARVILAIKGRTHGRQQLGESVAQV